MKPLPEVAAQLAEALAFALETLIRHHAGNTAADGFGMAALAAYRAFMEQPKAEAKSTCGGINCRVASDGTTFHDNVRDMHAKGRGYIPANDGLTGRFMGRNEGAEENGKRYGTESPLPEESVP